MLRWSSLHPSSPWTPEPGGGTRHTGSEPMYESERVVVVCLSTENKDHVCVRILKSFTEDAG